MFKYSIQDFAQRIKQKLKVLSKKVIKISNTAKKQDGYSRNFEIKDDFRNRQMGASKLVLRKEYPSVPNETGADCSERSVLPAGESVRQSPSRKGEGQQAEAVGRIESRFK